MVECRGHAGGAREKALVLDGEFWEAAGGVDAWRRLHGRPDRVQEVRLLLLQIRGPAVWGGGVRAGDGQTVSSPLAAVVGIG